MILHQIDLIQPPDLYGFQPCILSEATPQILADSTGGCGPGGVGDILVPDTLWGLNVKASCCIHDWMYHWGQAPGEKILADLTFHRNMCRQVKAADSFGLLENLRLRRAETYYYMVDRGGTSSFYANVFEELADG